MEMARATSQAEEVAVYHGTGAANQPRGINQTTGIIAVVITSDSPTYDNCLAVVERLAGREHSRHRRKMGDHFRNPARLGHQA